MKVWIVNQNAVSPGNVGATRHFFIARELVRRGHSVVIFASEFNHFNRQFVFGRPLKDVGWSEHEGVAFCWIPSSAYNRSIWLRLFAVFEFAWRLKKPALKLGKMGAPDLILGSSPQLLAAWQASQIAKALRIKFVLEVRDIWPLSAQQLGNFSSFNPVIILFKMVEKYLYKVARQIISIPGSALPYYEKFGVTQKIVSIPNFCNIDKNAQSERFPSHQDEIRVQYVGSLGIANDIVTILRAAEIAQSSEFSEKIAFEIIGSGPEKSNLVNLAQNLNLKNVRFIKPVPKASVGSLLRQADFFILPLKRVPVFSFGVSPNKLYDYMAAGRPIIFSVDSSEPWLSDCEGILKIPAENPAAMWESILSLARLGRAERLARGAAMRQYAMEKFSVELITDHFEKVFTDTLKRPDFDLELSRG